MLGVVDAEEADRGPRGGDDDRRHEEDRDAQPCERIGILRDVGHEPGPIERQPHQAAAQRQAELARQRQEAEAVRLDPPALLPLPVIDRRSEEHTSELQSLMRISYAVFCLKKKNIQTTHSTYS